MHNVHLTCNSQFNACTAAIDVMECHVPLLLLFWSGGEGGDGSDGIVGLVLFCCDHVMDDDDGGGGDSGR